MTYRWSSLALLLILTQMILLEVVSVSAASSVCQTVKLYSRLARPAARNVKKENGGIVSMSVIQQFSDINCVLGINFNYDGITAYSTRGCRADFEICQNTDTLAEPTTLPFIAGECRRLSLLSSNNARVTRQFEYELIVEFASIDLEKEISLNKCVIGSSFGFEIDGTTVTFLATDNCQGIFTVCAALRDYLTYRPPITCKNETLLSRVNRRSSKAIFDSSNIEAFIISMTLLEQLSDIACIEWTSFGYTGNVVEATLGCRGRFEICYEDFTFDTLTTTAKTPS